jgi:Cytochrome b5-like Heme/Steroid binding domain
MCIPDIQKVAGRVIHQPSSLTAKKLEKQLESKPSTPSSASRMATVRTFLALSICFASFWILSGSSIDVSLLPEAIGLPGVLSLLQKHPQAVLLLLAAQLAFDMLLCLNPSDTFRSTKIGRAAVEDIWMFVTVVLMLLYSLNYDPVSTATWNSVYVNAILCALIVKLASKPADGFLRTPSQSSKRYKSEVARGPKEAKDAMSWLIHGQQYDLSDFVDRHPGGKESILLGRGRDCTALFESYHAFTTQHR